MELTEIIQKLEALQARQSELLEKANDESSTAEDVKSFIETVRTEIEPEIARLKAERAAAEREAEVKALRATVETLDSAVEELRKPLPDFSIGDTSAPASATEDTNPYAGGQKSFFNDIRLAKRHDSDAISRLNSVQTEFSTKAMSEGVAAQGGYFVQPLIERQFVEAREQDNVIRGLVSKLNITTNAIELDQLSLGTSAGWVAELAQKPEATSVAQASVSASVFTMAGLATISNQLLADANPQIDRLVTADLAKRLVALEESAFLSGDGTGKPLGILNTPGIQTQTVTPTDVSADGGLLDSVLAAISKIQTEHGEPTAIVMHPRTWVSILTHKDADGTYTVGPDSVQASRDAAKTLFGYRVVLSNRVPTNLGAGTNESRVLVGDFSEALILDRQGITIDESPHVLFTSNQTIFRAEARVGFTAARTPKAFCVIGGVGLAV